MKCNHNDIKSIPIVEPEAEPSTGLEALHRTAWEGEAWHPMAWGAAYLQNDGA